MRIIAYILVLDQSSLSRETSKTISGVTYRFMLYFDLPLLQRKIILELYMLLRTLESEEA